MIANIKMTVEIRFVLVFASVSFVLSLFAGLISGIDFMVVLLRMFIFVPIFSGMGYGVALFFKKKVPEFYNIFSKESLNEDVLENDEANKEKEDTETVIEEQEDLEKRDDITDSIDIDGKSDEFNELAPSDFPQMSSDSGDSIGVDVATGKMGKHIVQNESFAEYEPKIMAEAVRTMMGKDDD